MHKTNGDNYMAQAIDTESRIGFFYTILRKKEDILDDAAELYILSANQYKLAKEWELAGKTFYAAAALYEQTKSHGTKHICLEGFRCYLNLPQTIENLPLIQDACLTAIAQSDSDFQKIGILYETLADYEYRLGDETNALVSYQNAIKYLEADSHSESATKKCILKLAKLYVIIKDYSQAGILFQKNLEDNIHSTYILNKSQFLYAFICELAENDIVSIKKLLDKYILMTSLITKTDEYCFMMALCDAIEKTNEKRFNNAIVIYTRSNTLDTWCQEILRSVVSKFDMDENDFS